MTQNRKRGRAIHEEETEFMPLSKRINNLHINGSLLIHNTHVNFLQSLECGPGPPCSNQSLQNSLPETPPETDQNNFNRLPCYSPELNEIQNPHYFSANKLLFEMYLERMQRNGQSFQV